MFPELIVFIGVAWSLYGWGRKIDRENEQEQGEI